MSEFTRLDSDPATEVIILMGAGRAFSAGLDLKELGQTGLQGEEQEGLDLLFGGGHYIALGGVRDRCLYQLFS